MLTHTNNQIRETTSDETTSEKKSRFSLKRMLTTLALAWILFWATSCNKENDDNIVNPKSPTIEWYEEQETPIEWVIKVRDILQNNADVRAYLGIRNADHYANQLEEQLKIVGWDPEHLWNILVKLYNELYFSSNAARRGEDDPRPDDARALRGMIAKLLDYIPNDEEIIIWGDLSNAWATTALGEAGKEMA